MSAAAAAPTLDAGAAPPSKKSRKKLVVVGATVLALLLLAGGGAAVHLKKQAAHAAEAAEASDGSDTVAATATKPDLKHPPTFLPLDPFVVNLADKEADRYAQIGITLEVEDAKFAEQMKTFMPAIRNGILMILAHKSSRELLERSGKEQLADQVLREAARTMGVDVAPAAGEAADAAAATEDDDADETPKAKSKTKAKGKAKAARSPAEPNPIRRVHFSNFIIQ